MFTRVRDETAETAGETGARSSEGGREAYLKQYVDRPSGEPARRQACRSGVSVVVVEVFVNNAGSDKQGMGA